MKTNRLSIKILSVVSVFLLQIAFHLAYSATITVPGDYPTIQGAINAATVGDEIIVSAGTYMENVNFGGKNIVLRSVDPTNASVVASSVIDGNNAGSVVTFSGSELTTCVLSGFTITNGYAPTGGGICGNGTVATIQNNHITTNTAYYLSYEGEQDGRGGGLWDCHGTVQNNVISGNSADHFGGGLAYCDATIQNNVISNNVGSGSSSFGGGLYDCDSTIQHNTISGNSAYVGGGLSWCNGVIQKNIISENSASYQGGGLYLCDGTIQNNIITGNSSSGAYSQGGGLYQCNGTIQSNTIAGNSATGSYSGTGGGLHSCDGVIRNNTITDNSASGGTSSSGGGMWNCTGLIINCIVWGNSAASYSQMAGSTPFYSCVQSWSSGGIGNISADPKFVDTSHGDYHLRSDSPCINSGNTYYIFGEYVSDIDGECRIAGAAVDMGSDEYGSSPDNDGDLLADSDEATQGSNPNITDTDGDGLRDGAEVLRGTSPIVFTAPSGISIPGNYPSIQQGIFLAFPAEVVTVSPATRYENLYVPAKNVILQSTNPLDENIVNTTIVDGSGLFSVILFEGEGSDATALRGLTIRNGSAAYGGGICGNGTKAAIERNKITGNSGYGGGLYDCDGIIQHNYILNNSTYATNIHGGGLARCDGTIQYNTISANSSHSYGGGIDRCDAAIQKNVISGNSASWGGGISRCNAAIQNNIIFGNSATDPTHGGGGGLSGCNGIIQGNIIVGNSATEGGGGLDGCGGIIQNNTIYGNSATNPTGKGGGFSSCSGLIVNCIIWANSAYTGSQLANSSTPSYSCIQGWTGTGRGNISADPAFVDPGNGNFHIQLGSPCIDAGNTYYLPGECTVDIDGECRLSGSAVDMGSDEYGSSSDSDGDLLADSNESTYGTNPNNPNTDGDGLRDGVEVLRGTSPILYNTPSGISMPAQYGSIQQALFLAFPLEVITLSPGTYDENLYFLGKNVILQSSNPLDHNIVNTTVIDGNGVFSVLCFKGEENETCAVKGLTIRNGYASIGGGICGNGALATIERNKILGNHGYEGAGLYGCNGIVQNNTVSDNVASGAGGGFAYCHGIIQNNTVSGNSGYALGGGLYECRGTIQNNIVSSNRTTHGYSRGGGLAECSATIQNNTIWGNSAVMYAGGLSECSDIRNCIVWQNTAANFPQIDFSTAYYCCIQNWTGGGTGNITSDPQLLDPLNGNFHLQPASPCIDAGCYVPDLTEDFEGDFRPYDGTSEPRGDGSDFDIGADEYVAPLPGVKDWDLY